MANSIIHFIFFGLILFIRARSGFALVNSGFAFERTTVFRCGIATERVTVFRSRMLPLVARTLASGGFAFEGTTVFRCGIVSPSRKMY